MKGRVRKKETKFIQQRTKSIHVVFLAHSNRAQLFYQLNAISHKQLKATTNFMTLVEDTIKTETR